MYGTPSPLCSWLGYAAFRVMVLIPGVTLSAALSLPVFSVLKTLLQNFPSFLEAIFIDSLPLELRRKSFVSVSLLTPSLCETLILKQYLKKTKTQVVSGKDYIPSSQVESSSRF